MKKYLAILLIIVAAIGCKKSGNTPIATGLTGKWELTQESGFFASHKTFATGTGNTIQFNADSTVIQYQNAVVVKLGNYSIAKNGTSTILYYNHQVWDVFFLQGSTLIIGNSAADGPSYIYTRIN
jgi:hypothetical protein